LEHGKGKKHPRSHPTRSGKAIRLRDVNGGLVAFWDVLWRMRKWVNYKEAQALLEGQDFEPHIEEFDGTLNVLLTTSATVIEHLLYALLGTDRMTEFYDDYVRVIQGKVDHSELTLRRSILTGVPF
jgi:hypothetical protein